MMAPPLLESDLGLRCVVALDEPELRRRPQRALCRALLESPHSEPTADASGAQSGQLADDGLVRTVLCHTLWPAPGASAARAASRAGRRVL